MSFESFPYIVGWELTLACNLRCRHCASAAGLPRKEELTTEEALALCDQFPPLAVQEVDFTGGEPLMRPDWWRIAARVAELGITTRIVTNGIPLVPGTVARIRDVGISTVGVSLDGLEATHDDIRALPGLWRRVLAGIEASQFQQLDDESFQAADVVDEDLGQTVPLWTDAVELVSRAVPLDHLTRELEHPGR